VELAAFLILASINVLAALAWWRGLLPATSRPAAVAVATPDPRATWRR